jgi:hypothetical protein
MTQLGIHFAKGKKVQPVEHKALGLMYYCDAMENDVFLLANLQGVVKLYTDIGRHAGCLVIAHGKRLTLMQGVWRLYTSIGQHDAGCMVITHRHGPQCRVCNPIMSMTEELP